MTRLTSLGRAPDSRRGAPLQVYSSEAGSLIEIHDAACACVVVIFSAESEGACQHALAVPEIRGEGDVWLHWSCACCGEGSVHCHPVDSD